MKKPDAIKTLGRRKSAIARVSVTPASQDQIAITVNGRDWKEYFNYFEWQDILVAPLKAVGWKGVTVAVRVSGGGIRGQAEAIRLAIARALLEAEAELRATLKKAGFLTRDSRIKERKKPGLKRARRAPQWSKR